MKYKSPLCSCIVCHETKSAKGIFTHYIVSHTEEGSNRLQRGQKNGVENAKKSNNKNFTERIKKYDQSPKQCINCNKKLDYDKKFSKFCNHSCSASYNNNLRSADTIRKQGNSLKETLKNIFESISKIKFKTCTYCYKNYTWHKGMSFKFCCIICKEKEQFHRLSTLAKDRGLGGVRPSKRILYKGVLLGSTYEVKLAESLDDNCIKWIKPARLNYVDPFGKERTYEADFYLPEYNVYLDPKNDFLINNINPRLGFKDSEKIHLVCKQNDVQIFILDKTQLTWQHVKNIIDGSS
jgi:hypothetical protein